MATFLIEARSTIPEDGQEDLTAGRSGSLDKALERAKELAREEGRTHGRERGLVYVYEEGTPNVWSVQWHPLPPATSGPVVNDDPHAVPPPPEYDVDGELVLAGGGRFYPVEFRVVHDPTERAVTWGRNDAGQDVVESETWEGALVVTDYDRDGNVVPVPPEVLERLGVGAPVEVRA